MKYLATLIALSLFPYIAFAQVNATIPDSDPEIERKSFIVAPGFEVNLFAADPLLAKPIQMNFDPQGRLWIASSEIYPQIKPGEKANDKILILEDIDGDGKADKTTVFADGLLIPTGIEPGDGGAYVANSTELVHLSASKPGGKADRTRVMLSGFGTEDTHHIIHTFRWGPDSALYFNQSIYIHSHLETPHGVKRLNAGGIWRYRPEVAGLDVFARGWVNSWGHHFDKYGQSFVTDGAGGEGINHAVPGASYLTAYGTNRILHGMNPGSPKYCGLEVVSGRHLPDDWQGSLITNDFRGHRVCRFVLRDNGSTYESREQQEVIKTNHPAFRPIDVKMGPDGAIYIADWYNPIIQHGEVDFRDPRRDHTHGRIWRITAKGRPLVPRPKLVGTPIPDLLNQLKSPEDWTRQQTKRVLKELGPTEVLPALATWVAALPADAEAHRLEALWMYQAFDESEAGLLRSLLSAKDPGVRAGAVRVLTHWQEKLADAPGLLAAAVQDESPRVRMEAIRGLAVSTAPTAVETALKALDKPMDKTLDYALWLTVRDLEPIWLPAFKAGELTFGGDAKKLVFALEASGSKDAVKPLMALLTSGKLSPDQESAIWLLVAQIGGPDELAKVFEHATKATLTQRVSLLKSLEDAARVRKVPAPKNLSLTTMIDEIANGSNPDNRLAARSACRLAGLWKDAGVRPALEGIAASAKDVAIEDREAAFDGLAAFNDARAKEFLTGIVANDKRTPVRSMALVRTIGFDLAKSATTSAELFADATFTQSAGDIFDAFLRQKGGPAALETALKISKPIVADTAKIGLRIARGSGQNLPGLMDALTKAGNLTAARKDPTPDEVKQFVVEVQKQGDPVRGEAIYRRKEMQCLTCHGVAGAGGQVGPDMTSIGASAQIDYLVESLLMPNKAVKEGYNAIEVETLSGKVVSGIKLRETKTELVLRLSDDKEVTIAADDVASKKNASSLMPVGLTDSLTRQEFVDLVRFMSELGKVGPYAPNRARMVRRWQVIDPLNENLNLFRRTRVSATAENPMAFVWSSAYTKVSGDLPVNDVPKFVVWNGSEPQSVVRFTLDVTAPGAAKLKFQTVTGLTVYLGNATVDVKPETVLDFKAGPNIVTILVDRTKRTEDLRVELEDVPGSTARVAIVGGK